MQLVGCRKDVGFHASSSLRPSSRRRCTVVCSLSLSRSPRWCWGHVGGRAQLATSHPLPPAPCRGPLQEEGSI